MTAVQSISNADYCLLYRNEGSTPRYFNDEDRPTDPRKKVDPKSFQRVQERFTSGTYDGIAVIKDGKVIEHLPGGKPAAPVVHLDAQARASVQTTSASSDTAVAARADAGAGARFTCLRYLHPIGKRFYLDSAGVLQKETLADGARATAHIVVCGTIERLEEAFRDATNSDIFVSGLPSSDGLTVVTKAKRGDGEIARTKDDLPFSQGPGVMFLDNDHPVGEGDNQFDAYVKAVPALTAASYVYAPSSSAWIHDAANGKEWKGGGGQHYAVPVKDASDIPRALRGLHLRLVLAGMGRPMVTKAGTVLIKSPVDTAMQTPNQPLFQRVSLDNGLAQRKADHIGSHSGDVFLFDSRLIADLTPEEQVRLADVERQLRESVADEAGDARGEWIEARVESVSARNEIPREIATEYLRTALTQDASHARFDLIPGIQIRFSGGWVDVVELLANPGTRQRRTRIAHSTHGSSRPWPWASDPQGIAARHVARTDLRAPARPLEKRRSPYVAPAGPTQALAASCSWKSRYRSLAGHQFALARCASWRLGSGCRQGRIPSDRGEGRKFDRRARGF